MSRGTAPSLGQGERMGFPSSFDGVASLTENNRRYNPQPSTPRKNQPTTPLTPSPYGNSATKLLETRAIVPSSRARPTISTYRQSSTTCTPSQTASFRDLPTSPPYTAVPNTKQNSFYSPDVFLDGGKDTVPPPTPESETDSDSDIFNPFSKSSIRQTITSFQALQHPQPHLLSTSITAKEREGREPSPLYAYPSSYEHTLLPSGLRLASPFGPSSSSSTHTLKINGATDLGTDAQRRREEEEEADDEGSSDEYPSARSAALGKREDEEHCQVFAKTTGTFDPFAADEWVPRSAGSAGFVAEEGKIGGGTETLEDSARRGATEDVKASLEEDTASGKFWSGSSRYLLIGGLGAGCDLDALKACIEVKVEVAAIVGQFLDPHGLAIIIFHDHRAAGFIYQAIQCGALRLSEREEVYVRFLQAEEVHRVVGNAIRPRLNECEARVCITFESSSSLIFPPIDQLKRTLSTFGDLQEFRSIGDSDSAFIAVFCDARIAPVAVKGLEKKYIGNAQLRLSLTCPLPDDASTLSTSAEREDGRTQGIIDARDLTRHLVQIRASTGFEPDVFKTQSWIGVPMPDNELFGGSPESLRAPYHSTFDTQDWDKTTLHGSPLETPTKSRRSNLSSRRLEDLFGNPVTPESKKKIKSVAFDLEPKPTTLIEQLNAKFSTLQSPSKAAALEDDDGFISDENVVPFRDTLPTHTLATRSLPVTPTKSLLGRDAYANNSPFSTSPVIRGYNSLHTTPQHVARLGQKARQIDIMKNVPREMLIDMEALRTGSDPRTSVMLKDIPNKLSRRQLIDCIQEIVPGEIDFAYLRFDFDNKCNVAYAFVNFTSVSALYRFAKARLGQRWNIFQSDKVLQMTYAKVQGKEAFIQHFANSPVMHCVEKWRPVLLNERGETVPFPRAAQVPYGRNRANHAPAFTGGTGGVFDPSSRRF